MAEQIDPAPPLRFGKPKETEPEPRARTPPKAPKERRATKRGRFFSLVSYASADDINTVAQIHSEQIRYWCYIWHDHDTHDDGKPKEPHFHILFDLYNANSESAVSRWFNWCKDENGEHVNTLCERGEDRAYLCDYLTHSNAKDKYQYPETAIERYSDMLLIAGVKPRNDQENALNIIDDMLRGATYYELMRHYGREFIINCARYEEMIARIINDASLPETFSRKQKNEIYNKYRRSI